MHVCILFYTGTSHSPFTTSAPVELDKLIDLTTPLGIYTKWRDWRLASQDNTDYDKIMAENDDIIDISPENLDVVL